MNQNTMITTQMNQNTMITKIDRGNGTFQWYQSEFDKHPYTAYDTIYISFGSKFNQTYIKYTLPYNKHITKYSNAEFQMLPHFYRNRPGKTLAICIDRFENEVAKQENLEILANIGQTEQNIEFIMCDLDGTIQLFEYITQYLIDKLSGIQRDNNKSMDETNFMIANYLRFISPNHTEYYLEQNLAGAIDKLLSKTAFRGCFYQWFGYQPNIYHFIYKYENQYISYMLHLLYGILEKTLDEEELTMYNKDEVRRMIDCPTHKKIYDVFMTVSHDICHA